MARRALMDPSELLLAREGAPLSGKKAIYARIPEELFNKLRRRSVELSEQGKKVTQQDVITKALTEYLK